MHELIKVVQNETFAKGLMSMDEYEQSMKHYEKRLSEVIEKLINLENERVHALRFTSKEGKLKMERERIIQMIKELQKSYLSEGKIETKTYELRLLSYERRIGEIDQSLATIEANNALTKFNPFNVFRK